MLTNNDRKVVINTSLRSSEAMTPAVTTSASSCSWLSSSPSSAPAPVSASASASASSSVPTTAQVLVEAAYTASTQVLTELSDCYYYYTSTTGIGAGAKPTDDDSGISQQQEQQQQQEEQRQGDGNADVGSSRHDPGFFSRNTNADVDVNDDNNFNGNATTTTSQSQGQIDSSSTSADFTKVLDDTFEEYGLLSACTATFWTTTESTSGSASADQDYDQDQEVTTSIDGQHQQRRRRRKGKHDDVHGGEAGDKSDKAVAATMRAATAAEDQEGRESSQHNCTHNKDYDNDEADDVVTIQTDFTRNTAAGTNTVMSCSVRSDTRSIHSFLMVNQPHRPATTISTSHQRQQFYFSTSPSKHSSTAARSQSLLPPSRSPYYSHNTFLSSPSTTLTESITEKDELVGEINNWNSSNRYGPSLTLSSTSLSSSTSTFDNVLTPSLMQQIKHHLPFARRDDSFWLQYSLVRDGASIGQLLRQVVTGGDCRFSVLAVETMDGEIFGAFLSHPWKPSQPNHWYGGGESFLWTTSYRAGVDDDAIRGPSSVYSKQPSVREMDVVDGRRTSIRNACQHNGKYNGRDKSKHRCSGGDGCNDDDKESRRREPMFVYHYTFANTYVQLCENDRLLLGGGFSTAGGDNPRQKEEGFGLALDGDLLTGSSHPCPTFGNPSLSFKHRDGSPFEIRNVEVWSLHPCLSLAETDGRKVVHRSRSSRPRTQTLKASSSSKQRRPSVRTEQDELHRLDASIAGQYLELHKQTISEDDFDPYGATNADEEDRLLATSW